MKFSIVKTLAILVAVSGISVLGVMVYQLLFSFKTFTSYGWAIKPLDEQTIQFQCGKIILYYHTHQDPETSKPVGYKEQLTDNHFCKNVESIQERFPFLASPRQQCQQLDRYTWHCQGDLVKASRRALRQEP
jgi:hypothetical protein